MVEDRSFVVQPGQQVAVEWIGIDLCVLGSRLPLTPEAVEKKWRKLLQQDEAASWPPLVGHWSGPRFVIDDGRHEFVAALMRGRVRVLVCWLVDAAAAGTKASPHNGARSDETAAKGGNDVPARSC
jgi:hypothetical protein